MKVRVNDLLQFLDLDQGVPDLLSFFSRELVGVKVVGIALDALDVFDLQQDAVLGEYVVRINQLARETG